jgi:hypothetical protein
MNTKKKEAVICVRRIAVKERERRRKKGIAVGVIGGSLGFIYN